MNNTIENKLGLTDGEKLVIKNNFFPTNASNDDIRFCMSVANQFGLNPLLNQIYFVERKSKEGNQWKTRTVPMVGKGGFLTIAHKSGKFAGIETTTTIKQTARLEGAKWVKEEDLVAICKVYRTDTERPFTVEVSFNEYAGKTRDGQLTKFWKEKPQTMIKKVSESQALRLAFDVSGIYAEEELNDINPVPKAEEQKETPIDDVSALLTEGLEGKNVDITTGEVKDELEGIEVETSSYMDKDYRDKPEEAPLHERQNTLELDID